MKPGQASYVLRPQVSSYKFIPGSMTSFLLSILSGILLSLPFFDGRLWIFAWAGFLPLFSAIQNSGRAKAFLISYITGIIFWSITIYWLIHVTLLGQILLILYLALYFGFFGLCISAIPALPAGRRYPLIFYPLHMGFPGIPARTSL